MQKSTQWNVWYVILALVGVLVLRDYVQQWQQVQPLSYSEFMAELDPVSYTHLTLPTIYSV